MHRRTLLATLSLLAGCSNPGPDSGDSDGGETLADSTPTATRSDDSTGAGSKSGSGSSTPATTDTPDVAAYGPSTIRADGNRLTTGEMDLRSASVADVPFPIPPVYVAGAPAGQTSIWAVVLTDGTVHGVRVKGDSASAVSLPPDAVEGPPLLAVGETNRVVVRDGLAKHTAPIPVDGGLAWVRSDGQLRTPGGVVAVDALPDAIPVASNGLVFVLARPTDAYGHGVLGDSVEATRVAVVDAAAGKVVRTLSPPTGVIEGRYPIVATLGGDDGVVVTASDGDEGARIVALGVDGSWEATGPPVGTGFRWRHQLAVAPFGAGDGEMVGAVRTPHIAGVAEFYRRNGSSLDLVATDSGGYKSHEIGSRNLGGGLAGRLVGDDRTVLVVPDGSRQRLVALHVEGGTVKQPAAVPLGGKLTSNLAAVGGGSPAVAAGTEQGLRFWLGKK